MSSGLVSAFYFQSAGFAAADCVQHFLFVATVLSAGHIVYCNKNNKVSQTGD